MAEAVATEPVPTAAPPAPAVDLKAWTQFRTILKPISAALNSAVAPLLPIPPLLELIAEYASDPPLVTTWFGNHTQQNGDFKNGTAAEAQFSDPMSVAPFVSPVDGELLLLVADDINECVRACNPRTGVVSVWSGIANHAGGMSGPKLRCAYVNPRSILVDSERHRVFVADKRTIRVVDVAPSSATSDVRTLVGDVDRAGYHNGVGVESRWHLPAGMAIVKAGAAPERKGTTLIGGRDDMLVVADTHNFVVRTVNLTSLQTATVAGAQRMNSDGKGTAANFERPRFMAFSRTTKVPDSQLYITCDSALRKMDVFSLEVTTVPLVSEHRIDPIGIAATPSGHLIISCYMTNSIWTIDTTARVPIPPPPGPKSRLWFHELAPPPPTTGFACVRLAGSPTANPFTYGASWQTSGLDHARFRAPWGIAMVESYGSLAVVDSQCHLIRRVPLPVQLFEPAIARND